MKKHEWAKSTRSGNDGQCVEVCDQGVSVSVRDSKDQAGPVLAFGPAQWACFAAAVKGGTIAS